MLWVGDKFAFVEFVVEESRQGLAEEDICHHQPPSHIVEPKGDSQRNVDEQLREVVRGGHVLKPVSERDPVLAVDDHPLLVSPEVAEDDVALILMGGGPEEQQHPQDVEPPGLHEDVLPDDVDILVVHGHLAQNGQAHEDIVDEAKAVLHDVDGGPGEDADVQALEEAPQAVQPQEQQRQESGQCELPL